MLPDPSLSTTRRRTAWLAGLVLGVVNGFLLFEFPILAVVLLLASAVLVTRSRSWTAGLGGLAIGLGGLWVLVLGRARASCDAFNEVPGQGCVMPTVDGYLIAGAIVALAGIALTIHAWRSRSPA